MTGVALDHIEIFQHGAGEGVVLGHIAALLLAVLKQREFGDPQKIEGAGLDEAELLGEVVTQLAQRIIDDLILGVGHDEQQVALFGIQCLVNSRNLLLGEEFAEGGGRSLRRPADPGEAFRADPPYVFGQFVDFLAGQDGRRSLGGDAAHRAAA